METENSNVAQALEEKRENRHAKRAPQRARVAVNDEQADFENEQGQGLFKGISQAMREELERSAVLEMREKRHRAALRQRAASQAVAQHPQSQRAVKVARSTRDATTNDRKKQGPGGIDIADDLAQLLAKTSFAAGTTQRQHDTKRISKKISKKLDRRRRFKEMKDREAEAQEEDREAEAQPLLDGLHRMVIGGGNTMEAEVDIDRP